MHNSKIKNKYLVNIDNYTTKTENKLIFLILIMAVLPSALSGKQNMNVWEKLIYILQDPIANLLFYIALIIIMLCIRKRICYNELFYSRFKNYKEMIENGKRAMLISTVAMYTTFIIVALAASTFLCLGNYGLINYEKYNIPIIIYLAFIYIKNILLYTIVLNLVLKFSIIIKNKYIKYTSLLISFLCFFINNREQTISHFYQIPLIFQSYLLETNFISFYVEFIVFIIFVLILSSISKVINEKFMVKGKKL